jgi:hypothetical protein
MRHKHDIMIRLMNPPKLQKTVKDYLYAEASAKFQTSAKAWMLSGVFGG